MITVTQAMHLGGMKTDLGEFFTVQNLRAQHRRLDFRPILAGDIGIENSQRARIRDKLDCVFTFIESALLNRRTDFVLVSESRQHPGFVNPNRQHGLLGVDRGWRAGIRRPHRRQQQAEE